MKYIIKLSPEITIKSKPVRKRCIVLLKNNIKKHCDYNNITVHLSGSWDVINLEYQKEFTCTESKLASSIEIKNILKRVP
jgi:thiamine biosynthesis protein ThiI